MVCMANKLLGQQNPYFRFYQQNWQFVNPAAMDRHMMLRPKKDYYNLNMQVRQQWVGFEGAPLTLFVSGERKPKMTNEPASGPKFGFTGYFDKTDAFHSFGIQGNYSYMIQLDNSRNVIHLGVGMGLQNFGLKEEEIIPTLVDPDDLAILDFQSRNIVEASIGALFRAGRSYYLGVSMPQMVRAFAWKQNGESGLYGPQLQQICFLGGGYINLTSSGYDSDWNGQDAPNETDASLVLEPSVLVRVTPDIRYINLLGNRSPISFDANFRVYGFDKFWGGAGYSSNGTASLELGMNVVLNERAFVKKGYRIGITSSFPFLGRNPSLGTSMEVFGSYVIR